MTTKSVNDPSHFTLHTMQNKQPQGIFDNVKGIASGIQRLGMLYFEKARLQTAEKITILLSTIAFTAVMLALIVIFLAFVCIGVGHLLASTIAPHWAYMIVAGFYLIVILVAVALRRPIFIDPIARFMSRLLVEAPEADDPGDMPMTPRSKRQDDEVETPEPDSDSTDIDAESEPEDQYDEIARRIAAFIKNRGEKRESDDDREPDEITIIEVSDDDADDSDNDEKDNEKGGDE